jgi:hypothetical protein
MLTGEIDCSYLCGEEAELRRFRLDPESPYAERLKRYKDIDRYYPGKRFAALTDGIGCTRTFRTCLGGYIKEFEPYPFPENAEWVVMLNPDGSFVLEGPGAERERDDETNRLFEFLCFLHINTFWGRVEELRGCRLADSPLIVEKRNSWVIQRCGEELLTRLCEGRKIYVE